MTYPRAIELQARIVADWRARIEAAASDGIGLATAEMLAPQVHTLLLHGRSAAKLDAVRKRLSALPGAGRIETPFRRAASRCTG